MKNFPFCNFRFGINTAYNIVEFMDNIVTMVL